MHGLVGVGVCVSALVCARPQHVCGCACQFSVVGGRGGSGCLLGMLVGASACGCVCVRLHGTQTGICQCIKFYLQQFTEYSVQ